MAVVAKRLLRNIIAVLILAAIANGSGEEGSGGDEGSGDVCNVDGSTCPENKCCRDKACEKDGGELHCCTDPSSDPSCANCPTCGKNCSIFFIQSSYE